MHVLGTQELIMPVVVQMALFVDTHELLRQIVRDLLESGELPPQERKYSIYGPSQAGSFKFLMLHRAVPLMSELSRTDEIILNLKYAVRRAAGSVIQWYGLDTSSVIVEQAPLVIPSAHENEKRIQRAK